MDYAPFIKKLELPSGFTAPVRMTYDNLVATVLTRECLREPSPAVP